MNPTDFVCKVVQNRQVILELGEQKDSMGFESPYTIPWRIGKTYWCVQLDSLHEDIYNGAKGDRSLSIIVPRVYAVFGKGVLTDKELNPHPIINAFGKIGIVSCGDEHVVGFVDITKDETMCRPTLLAFPNHCTKNQPLFESHEEATLWATKWVDDKLEEQLIEARYRTEWVKKRLEACRLTNVEPDTTGAQQARPKSGAG